MWNHQGWNWKSKLPLPWLYYLPVHGHANTQDPRISCLQPVLCTDLDWTSFIKVSSQPSTWPQIGTLSAGSEGRNCWHSPGSQQTLLRESHQPRISCGSQAPAVAGLNLCQSQPAVAGTLKESPGLGLSHNCIYNSLTAFVRLVLHGIAYPLKVMNLIYLRGLRWVSILVEAMEQWQGAGEDPGKIYLCGNLPPTALSRPCSADLQSFAIHISCVATPKLVQIYITVGSRRKYRSEAGKQTRVWTEVSGGTDGLCHLHSHSTARSGYFLWGYITIKLISHSINFSVMFQIA